MHDFEAIRPYEDREVPAVIARLLGDRALQRAVAQFLLPRLNALLPGLARWLVVRQLKLRTRGISTVAGVQRFLEGYMRRIVEDTVAELTVSGLDALDTSTPYLFISNHRDIVLDSGVLNYVIYHAGHDTARPAVGDNLLTEAFAADLMRLNKSFVVERSVSGRKAVYQALMRTSAFIRHSLCEGHSVWIAQREGRSKDGYDRTEPALLKMLALAWRDEIDGLPALLERIRLVPVSISYELDPCDLDKAHELTVRERDGAYEKGDQEDLMSIVRGLTGYKGRMHLHFSAPLEPQDLAGTEGDAEALAELIDRAIVGGLKVFPTQVEAARRLALAPVPDAGEWLAPVRAAFDARLAQCPEDELPALLSSYGNLVRNRNDLEIQPA
jgi:hypothetical protein